MRRKLKAVLFDMDGVIIDSEFEFFDRIRKTLKHKGVDLTVEELIETYLGISSDKIYSGIIENHGFSESVEELRAEHYRLQGNYYSDADIEPIHGLIKTLDYLSTHGVRMAVVSSTGSKNVLFALNRLNLIKYFDYIVTGDLVKVAKPSPEIYMKAASFLGVTAEDSFAIEDSGIGIKAAQGAGLKVIGFSGAEVKNDLSDTDVQVESFDELIEYIEKEYEC